jgi:hypothetical protein
MAAFWRRQTAQGAADAAVRSIHERGEPMTSDLQPTARQAASRRNGARSRGPGTAAGKVRSSKNALRHGCAARKLVLLDDENPAEFRAFAKALQAELAVGSRSIWSAGSQ